MPGPEIGMMPESDQETSRFQKKFAKLQQVLTRFEAQSFSRLQISSRNALVKSQPDTNCSIRSGLWLGNTVRRFFSIVYKPSVYIFRVMAVGFGSMFA
jgi:hypothetical protein